jgi:hypothetical protein
MEVNVVCSPKKVFPIFERRILRMIYSPVNDNGMWKTRYSNVLYTPYDELDIVKVIKTGTEMAGTPLQNARSGSSQKA